MLYHDMICLLPNTFNHLSASIASFLRVLLGSVYTRRPSVLSISLKSTRITPYQANLIESTNFQISDIDLASKDAKQRSDEKI